VSLAATPDLIALDVGLGRLAIKLGHKNIIIK